jgi:hypothetical protein
MQKWEGFLWREFYMPPGVFASGRIWIVYGWRIDRKEALQKALSDMTIEAYNRGLRIVVSTDGKKLYLGEVLARFEEGLPDENKIILPAEESSRRLLEAMELLGLEDEARKEPAALWIVAA